HFGAVDYQATVWLNGAWVGEHEGGYLPFEFDVTSYLRVGENELLVRVVDPSDDRERYPDTPFSELPHGKQSWYGPIGGIWQSVWLEYRPGLHIRHLELRPKPDEAAIEVRVELSRQSAAAFQLVCSVEGPNGENVVTATFADSTGGIIVLPVAPQLWHPDTPNLYTVTAIVQQEGQSPHSVQKHCGFRTVTTRAGHIELNGEPIYLRGALDQAYYPETIYTPGSLALLEDQALKAKALGFNCLRTLIKIEDPRYYDVADRIGLLIWTEIPNWAHLSAAAAERAEATFVGMVRRDGHHPSIIAWTLINENWGTDLTRNAAHRRWLADFYQRAKALDPTRLVVDNSACHGNAHVVSDLEDFHHYRVIPDHAGDWDDWVAAFAARSDWAWYADFAAERKRDLPLLVSEFGNWGLPDPNAIQEAGAEPWWFETGHEWGEGIVYPHGVEARFAACGLADLFSSYAEFALHSQRQMARSLHYEITSMRLQQAISGYVVTEFTDVHWECNGMLTMQRQPKHALDPILKEVNQDRVVLLRPSRWNGRPGEVIELLVRAVGVCGEEDEGFIVWAAGGETGRLTAPGQTIAITLQSPGITTVTARWLAADGHELAANHIELVCVAPLAVATPLVVVDDPALASVCRELGYQVAAGHASQPGVAGEGSVVIARRYTEALEAFIQRGGRVILLADVGEQDELNRPLPQGRIVARANTAWQGDWANSYAWAKKQGPLAAIPGEPLLDMAWTALMPDAVIAGLPSWVLRSHSWAGLAVGWVHKAVSLLSLLPYGKGKLLITTFKLNDATLAVDALGQTLLAAMVNLLQAA
ncbi:MAG: hypothetical protein KDE04_13100, partial [Anaerolineales bacterium]|nr:hypothetical protein [Anaerolineales bacterium]